MAAQWVLFHFLAYAKKPRCFVAFNIREQGAGHLWAYGRFIQLRPAQFPDKGSARSPGPACVPSAERWNGCRVGTSGCTTWAAGWSTTRSGLMINDVEPTTPEEIAQAMQQLEEHHDRLAVEVLSHWGPVRLLWIGILLGSGIWALPIFLGSLRSEPIEDRDIIPYVGWMTMLMLAILFELAHAWALRRSRRRGPAMIAALDDAAAPEAAPATPPSHHPPPAPWMGQEKPLTRPFNRGSHVAMTGVALAAFGVVVVSPCLVVAGLLGLPLAAWPGWPWALGAGLLVGVSLFLAGSELESRMRAVGHRQARVDLSRLGTRGALAGVLLAAVPFVSAALWMLLHGARILPPLPVGAPGPSGAFAGTVAAGFLTLFVGLALQLVGLWQSRGAPGPSARGEEGERP